MIEQDFDLTFNKPITPKHIKIYYDDISGNIMGVSVAPLEELKEYSIREVSWEEGKDFLSGIKSSDNYFVNVNSIRKEIVKRNLVQISGHGHNFDYFDILDYIIKDKDKADIIIKQSKNKLKIISNVEFYPLYLTLKKEPLKLLTTIEYTGEKVYEYNINTEISLYADFKYYRTLKIYYEKYKT